MATARRKPTPAPSALEVVVGMILDGELDSEFDRVQLAIKERRSTLTSKLVASLQIGSKVRFNSLTRPTYLRGIEGTVVGFKQKKVSVEISEAVGRFSGTAPITTPADLLEVI